MKRLYLISLLMIFSLLQPGGMLYAEFEETGISPRVISMGNAFTGLCDDSNSIYYNPAGLAFLPRKEFLCSYSRLHMGLDDVIREDSTSIKSGISSGMLGYAQPVNKVGTFGVGWLNTSLLGLYGENTFMMSFAKRLIRNKEEKEVISFGVNLKLLNKVYTDRDGDIGIAFDDNGEATTDSDPVFEAGLSKMMLSLDIGAFYRINRHYSVGLFVGDVNQPNSALEAGATGATSIPMKIRAGLAFKNRTRDLNLVADLYYRSGDIRLLAGAEKWFKFKTIAVRGGVGIGSRRYRNLTLGAGYRIDQFLELGYAFVYPLSGLGGTLGSHRASLTVKFGDVVEDFQDEYDAELSMIKAEIAKRKHLKGLTLEEENMQKAENFYLEAKRLSKNGLYAAALRKLDIARILDPSDRVMENLSEKLEKYVKIYPMKIEIDKESHLLRRGIVYYNENEAKRSINTFQYLTEVYPNNERIAEMYKMVAREYPNEAKKEKLSEGINLVEQKLFRALSHLYENRFDFAISEANEVLEIEPENVTAYMRLGSAYYLMGNTMRAMEAWKMVFALDPGNRELAKYLNKARIPIEVPEALTDKQKAAIAFKKDMDYYGRIEDNLETADKIYFLNNVSKEFGKLVNVDNINDIIKQLNKVLKGQTYDRDKATADKNQKEADAKLKRMKKYYTSAVDYFNDDNYNKAIRDLRKILKINATHDASLKLIKKIEKVMDMSEEEREVFKMKQYFGAGLNYYQKAEYKKALVEFERLLKISPEHPQSLRIIGKIKEQLNPKSEPENN